KPGSEVLVVADQAPNAGNAVTGTCRIFSNTRRRSFFNFISEQHHVVLFLMVQRLYLELDRTTDEFLKLQEAAGLFVQQQIDHRLRRDDQIFIRTELARLAENFPEDFITRGMRRLERTAALA